MCKCLNIHEDCLNAFPSWMASSYELCHVSVLLTPLCRSFHESLSLRHAPLPPCLQICFTHCNKAFILSLWCLCCFAAPLHCSPSVNVCCCVVSVMCVPFHFSYGRWWTCSTKHINIMWYSVLFAVITCLLICTAVSLGIEGIMKSCCCFLFNKPFLFSLHYQSIISWQNYYLYLNIYQVLTIQLLGLVCLWKAL